MSKKKCLLVINRFAGNYKVGDEETIKKSIGDEYELTVLYVSDETDSVTRIEGYDLVVVSGGDGTLNRLINRDIARGTEVRYYPSGTLNEAADRRVRRGRVISAVGSADGRLFTYVLAAGTFTPLGYVVDFRKKQRFKALAYIARVVKEYKVNRIPAEITADGKKYEGVYTLIMIINSPRCFGFRFNRMYRDGGPMCLLTIRAPKTTGFFGKIAIFFPFFRTFFMGFGKPHFGKTVTFTPFNELDVSLGESVTFCADGEAVSDLTEKFKVTVTELPFRLVVAGSKRG